MSFINPTATASLKIVKTFKDGQVELGLEIYDAGGTVRGVVGLRPSQATTLFATECAVPDNDEVYWLLQWLDGNECETWRESWAAVRNDRTYRPGRLDIL